MPTRWFPDDMPRPAVSRETLPWWQAAAEHRLVVQTCSNCGSARHPPGPMCPRCRSTAHEWAPLSGRGRVYSFTVVRQAFLPSLAAHLPYVVAILDLDGAEGVRLITNLVEVDPGAVAVGMPIEVVWDDVAPGLALPRFRTLPGGDR